MTYMHHTTGLEFRRTAGCEPVYVTGNTYEHRQSLYAAGFRWCDDSKRYEGTVHCLANLNVPRAWEIARGLGVRVKTRIGGSKIVKK